jgi:hypothetical protein
MICRCNKVYLRFIISMLFLPSSIRLHVLIHPIVLVFLNALYSTKEFGCLYLLQNLDALSSFFFMKLIGDELHLVLLGPTS